MAKRDYYEVLGLSRGASEQDIKAAFRRLAKDCHPDRNQGDKNAEHKFKELNEAYDVLKDDQRRAAYDQFGHAAFEAGGTSRGGGFDLAKLVDRRHGDFQVVGNQRRRLDTDAETLSRCHRAGDGSRSRSIRVRQP